ncbi:hypothetical protein MA03_06045 [Infirmifilum uzonense]|uniref:Uncharacterized protein n=1 Tax=Infirmifilum uzonense TaxID=1550241 RepID=A0A0F7FHU0_9CREN|nr:hypothetical protein [Infirmifilum uzonense]AKG38902.1 hypothetical protein MA03_06045 [Infirmifilum uzonense]
MGDVQAYVYAAFISRPKSCTRIAPFKAYADILPDHRKALDSIDAILEELEEHRSMLENLLEE